MIYFYNDSRATGTTYSFIQWLGSTNAPSPLSANPTQCCAVSGATVDITIVLQAAVTPTPVNQNVTPLEGDWFDVQTFNNSQVFDAPSLNGLWVRFKVINSSGSAAPVSAMLG